MTFKIVGNQKLLRSTLYFLFFVCLHFSQDGAMSLTQNVPNFNIKRLLDSIESSKQYDNSVWSPF